MHFADLVDAARVEQDALGGGGFPRVNMGDNADIAGLF
jgi:hypothetical protein